MRSPAIPAALFALALAGPALAQADYGARPDDAAHGVADPQRAWQAYVLNCQGCHRADGTGDARSAPALAGHMAVFTQVPGGREYLSRVPGAATAPLSDAALAEVLNWALWRFDADHVARGFRPYEPGEVGAWRRAPLRTEAAAVRAALLAAAPAPDRPPADQGRGP